MQKNKAAQVALCIIAFVLFVMTCISLIGCVSTDKRVNTGLTLKATKDVFVVTARGAKRLCEAEVISDSDCKKIEDAYIEGRDLLISAEKIWSIASSTNSKAGVEETQKMMMEISQLASIIEHIIQDYD